MGSDKSSLAFGRETMLERVSRTLRGITDEVIVVGRRDQAAVTVHDAIEDQGPLAGLVAGLNASTTDLNLVVACDMPLVNPAVLQRMVSMIGDADVCVATSDGHASALCGIYRSRVKARAAELFNSGERRVVRLLDAVRTYRVDATVFRDLDPELHTFKSFDTPDAYQRALEILSRSPIPDP